jgi:D-3-phosphoglycerate dehydrogenase
MATRLGIPVAYVPAASVEEVSDHALALLLASERRLFDVESAARKGDVGAAGTAASRARQFSALTLGIVGFGRIGRALARKSRGIFATVLACDPLVDSAEAAGLGVELVELSALVARSDLISFHAPGSADGSAILDRDLIGRMRQGVIVVNTARGELIDEGALVDAVLEGRIAGAALDVTVVDPLPASDPLWTIAGIRATGHTGAKGTRSGPALRTAVVDAVLAALCGAPPQYLANPEVIDRPACRLKHAGRPDTWVTS